VRIIAAAIGQFDPPNNCDQIAYPSPLIIEKIKKSKQIIVDIFDE
jgi:AAA+ ATPase superfamily predicted ATPase